MWASWTLHTARPQIPTPGKNRKVTVLGAVEGDHRCLGVPAGPPLRRDFIALLDQVLRAFPAAPVIVMICDNDSSCHARKVTAYLDQAPPAGTVVRRPVQP